MEEGGVTDSIAMVEDTFWDALVIQEGNYAERSGCSAIDGGYLLFSSTSPGSRRTVCVLLHARWSLCKASWRALSSRMAYLDLDVGTNLLRIVSAHLPRTEGAEDDIFEACLLYAEEGASSHSFIKIPRNAVEQEFKILEKFYPNYWDIIWLIDL